jgi:transcriptional regulator with XRE-family HTH domain
MLPPEDVSLLHKHEGSKHMFDMMRIGRRIADLRREKNLTQMELSDKLGISHQAVSKWERGESMPDISTLPLLSAIFGISVDRLLESAGRNETRVLKSVLEGKTDTAIDEGTVTLHDIGDIAPLLKPSQIDEMAAQCRNISIEDLSGIAPFLSLGVLDKLAKDVAEVDGIGALCGIAPFVSREVLDKLAEKAVEVGGISELCGIAPFVSQKVLDKMAERITETGDIGELCGIAPFISKEILDNLAVKAVAAGGISELGGIAPFVSQEIINRLAEEVAEVHSIGELCCIAPFVSPEVLDRLAIKAAQSDGNTKPSGKANFLNNRIFRNLHRHD